MAKVFLKKPDDIGEDNIYLISPAQVYGATGGNEVVVLASPTMLNATKMIEIDANVEMLVLSGSSSDYAFKATGNTVQVFKTGASPILIGSVVVQDDDNGTGVTFAPSLDPTDVNNLTTYLAIVPKEGGGFDVKLGEQVLSSNSFTTVTPPATEAPTEAPTEPVTEAPTEAPERADVSLDSPAGTPQSARVIDAQDGAYLFGDDVLQTSFTRIENFGADDAILFANLGDKRIAVSNSGNDVSIQVNDGSGHVSVITVVGVTNAEALIGSVSAFNALAVGDILN